MANEIGLGWRVKDKITGLEGIVNHTVLYAGQGPMVGVVSTALDKEGKVRDAEMFDVTQLEILSDKPLFEIPGSLPFAYDFGDEVKDTITGYKGKVAGLARFINGCNRVLVRPPHDPKSKDSAKNGEFISEATLALVKRAKGADKKLSKNAPVARGGPADFRSAFP